MNCNALHAIGAACVLSFFIMSSSSGAFAQSEYAPKEGPLMTKWAKDVDPAMPHPEYPRPQMERGEWLNLNGVWEFEFTGEGAAPKFGESLSRKILVPFPPESALSGIMEHGDRALYRRTFEIPENWAGKDVLLNFGAVDYEAEVFVNGESVGTHKGGYLPFSFNVTEFLKPGENELIVRVFDPTEKGGQPHGKQTTNPTGIIYTPTSGIWQTVWLEPVSKAHISSLKITPDIDKGEVSVTALSKANGADVSVEISGPGLDKKISAVGKTNEPIIIKIDNPRLWSPGDPYLYDMEVSLSDGKEKPDAVKSYFGMRKISVGSDGKFKRIFLNNKEVFMVGPLDQGFWPDGIYTAPTDEALRYDIEETIKCGFNFARKHIKIEPARWYYWADKLGLMVWQDMPSINSYVSPVPIDKESFESQLRGALEFLHNSPAVVMWVIFNEGCGQHDTEKYAALAKELDPTRLVNDASGGHSTGTGDMHDIHSYPAPRVSDSGTQVRVCGEFGGIGYYIPKHSWNSAEGFSYIGTESPDGLLFKYANYFDAVRKMREEQGLSAVVYTQTTDVENEINGLYTYDRIPKVSPASLKKINTFNFTPPKMEPLLETSETSPSEWKFVTDAPAGGWEKPGFDDSSWNTAPAGFGDAAATKGNTPWHTSDIWIRKSFTLPKLDAETKKKLFWKLFHDEDVEIYINGVRAFSRGGFVTDYEYFQMDGAAADALKEGENTIAIHCRQTTGGQYIDAGICVLKEWGF